MANNPLQVLTQFMQSGKNPEVVLQQLIKQNPQMNTLINQMRNSGMSPRDFTKQYFKQNNLDFGAVENLMNNKGGIKSN